MQHAYENATCGKHRYQTKQHIERDLARHTSLTRQKLRVCAWDTHIV